MTGSIRIPIWDLEFAWEAPADLDLQVAWDAATSSLTCSVSASDGVPAFPEPIRLRAALGSSVVGGSACLETMLSDEPPTTVSWDVPTEATERSWHGRGVVALELPSRGQPCLVVGALDLASAAVGIQLDIDSDALLTVLTLEFDISGLGLSPGATHQLPPVVLLSGSDANDLLSRYAVAVHPAEPARHLALPVVALVPPGAPPLDVLAAHEAAGYRPAVLCAQSAATADWLELARIASAHGFAAGARVELASAPRDWLDAAREAGLAYVELTGLPESATDARLLLAAARDALGDDVFLLAEGPLGAGIGLVDAMRNAPSPGSGVALSRAWMTSWWRSTPGPLAADPGPAAIMEAILSGGPFSLLAPLPLGSRIFPPTGCPAVPVAGGHLPAWRADVDAERALLGILNTTTAGCWFGVSEYLRPGEVAFDPFAARLLGKGDIFLAPGGAGLWQVTRPGPTPRVVGDSGNVNYARLFERRVSGRVQVRNDSPDPRVVAVEARGQVFDVELAPGEMRWFD